MTRYHKYAQVVPDSGDEGEGEEKQAAQSESDSEDIVARRGRHGSESEGSDEGAWDYSNTLAPAAAAAALPPAPRVVEEESSSGKGRRRRVAKKKTGGASSAAAAAATGVGVMEEEEPEKDDETTKVTDGKSSALTSIVYPALSSLLEAQIHGQKVKSGAVARLKIAFDSLEADQPGLTEHFVLSIIAILRENT